MLRKTGILLLAIGMLGTSFPGLSRSANGVAPSPAPTSTTTEGASASAASSPSTGVSDEDGYLIGPGDVLDISVWKDEALTRSCVVRPDGAISFPLIGEIRATGKTAVQLKEEMEGKLVRYVPELVLSLDVRQVNSLIIYVIGKVNSPGRQVVNANINVLQALATAAGLNPFAKRNRIKIYRQQNGKTEILPFEYDEVVDGKRLEQNIRLQRGDVVVVP